MEISLNTTQPILPANTEELEKSTSTESTAQVGSILNEALGVMVQNVKAARTTQTQSVQIELDEVLEAFDEDLETLIGLLQLEQSEKDAAVAKERIKQLSAQFQSIHDGRMKKIDEAIKKQEKADKAAKRNKWLSIFGAVIAVVAAVVTSVFTLGASTVVTAGIIAASLSIASAAIAVTGCALTLSGGDEKLMEALAKVHQKCSGCSDKTAKKFASDFYAYFGIALSGLCAIGSLGSGVVNSIQLAGKEVTYLVSAIAQKVINHTMQGIGLVNSSVSTGFGADSMHKNSEASKANAETKEIAAFIQLLQKEMDDAQEMLENIVNSLQNTVAQILDILDNVANSKIKIEETVMMV